MLFRSCTDSAGGKVAAVASDGTIEWEFACDHPQDCWVLPNGNFPFCHSGGALEMTRDKKTVWEYKAGEKTEVHACQPRPDGIPPHPAAIAAVTYINLP